tara:strand:+ start:306 stop:476 length:171 start_codon:yes stop_codon:yes gene_type:complete
MENVIKEVEVIEVPEAIPAPPAPTEPEGGGISVGSITAIVVAAVAVYVIGRLCCKK